MSQSEEVVDHNSNDRRCTVDFIHHFWVSRVRVHWVEPFNDDQDIHPSEKTVQNNKTSNDFSPELHLLAEIESVKTFGYDTHRHMHNANNN